MGLREPPPITNMYDLRLDMYRSARDVAQGDTHHHCQAGWKLESPSTDCGEESGFCPNRGAPGRSAEGLHPRGLRRRIGSKIEQPEASPLALGRRRPSRQRGFAKDGLRDARFRQEIEQAGGMMRCRARLSGTPRERREDQTLRGARCNQRDFVHPAGLTQSVDPAGTLFDSRRAPRQLVVDDEATVMMKVQTLGSRVGCKQ
jgi:hypothetical protein